MRFANLPARQHLLTSSRKSTRHNGVRAPSNSPNGAIAFLLLQPRAKSREPTTWTLHAPPTSPTRSANGHRPIESSACDALSATGNVPPPTISRHSRTLPTPARLWPNAHPRCFPASAPEAYFYGAAAAATARCSRLDRRHRMPLLPSDAYALCIGLVQLGLHSSIDVRHCANSNQWSRCVLREASDGIPAGCQAGL